MIQTGTAQDRKPTARERILDTAYDLFSRRGIRAVGVDEVVERAGVAKATLYRHFPSKDDLVLAYLQLREQRWTFDWVEAEAQRRGATPEDQLLAIFDAFDEWFHQADFEACSFINVLLEMGFGSSIRREWAWRVKNDQPLANLAAFADFAQRPEAQRPE